MAASATRSLKSSMVWPSEDVRKWSRAVSPSTPSRIEVS
jgi:hypothetical protein